MYVHSIDTFLPFKPACLGQKIRQQARLTAFDSTFAVIFMSRCNKMQVPQNQHMYPITYHTSDSKS